MILIVGVVCPISYSVATYLNVSLKGTEETELIFSAIDNVMWILFGGIASCVRYLG